MFKYNRNGIFKHICGSKPIIKIIKTKDELYSAIPQNNSPDLYCRIYNYEILVYIDENFKLNVTKYMEFKDLPFKIFISLLNPPDLSESGESIIFFPEKIRIIPEKKQVKLIWNEPHIIGEIPNKIQNYPELILEWLKFGRLHNSHTASKNLTLFDLEILEGDTLPAKIVGNRLLKWYHNGVNIRLDVVIKDRTMNGLFLPSGSPLPSIVSISYNKHINVKTFNMRWFTFDSDYEKAICIKDNFNSGMRQVIENYVDYTKSCGRTHRNMHISYYRI